VHEKLNIPILQTLLDDWQIPFGDISPRDPVDMKYSLMVVHLTRKKARIHHVDDEIFQHADRGELKAVEDILVRY
jgi:hypothetical protein